jgi:chemotaxis family two-component system response regulator Rcp1
MTGPHAEILLVEDNPTDVLLTQQALKGNHSSSHLSVVGDGVEALAFLRHEGSYANAPTPDLILMDLNLPKKGAVEVLLDIKACDALKSIPVVILSTSDAGSDVRKAYELHANCYVVKPLNYSTFCAALKLIEDFWLTLVKLPSRD